MKSTKINNNQTSRKALGKTPNKNSQLKTIQAPPARYFLGDECVRIELRDKYWSNDLDPSRSSYHITVTAQKGNSVAEMGKLGKPGHGAFEDAKMQLTEYKETMQHLAYLLLMIYNQNLFKETHPTFNAFCKDLLNQ